MSYLENKRRGLMGVSRHVRGEKITVTKNSIQMESSSTIKLEKAYDDPIYITSLYGNKQTENHDYHTYRLTLPLFQSISFGGLYADSGPATTWYIDAEGDYYYTFYDYGFYFDTHGYGTPTYILNTAETVIYLKDDIGTKPIDITVSRVKKTEADISQMTKVFTVEKTETVQIRGSCYALLGDKYGVFDLTDDAAANEVLVFDSFLGTLLLQGEETFYPYALQDTPPESGIDLSFISAEDTIVYLRRMIPVGGDVKPTKNDVKTTIFSLPTLRGFATSSTTSVLDKISSKGDLYIVERNIGELVLSGTEDGITYENGLFAFPLENTNIYSTCTHFTEGNPSINNNRYKIEGGKLYIRHDDTPTLASFKPWLEQMQAKGHPFTLWYKRATPITEEANILPCPEMGDSVLSFSGAKPYSLSFQYSSYKTQAKSFKFLQQIVRGGIAHLFFSVGDQITCRKGSDTLVWDIIGFDQDTPADPSLTHSMTLQLNQCYSQKKVFDENGSVSWQDSSIRSYLNSEFLQDIEEGFSSVLGKVKKSTEGVESEDTVFIGSLEETVGELDKKGVVTAPPTYDFYRNANEKGDTDVYFKIRMGTSSTIPWWTRTPGGTSVDQRMYVVLGLLSDKGYVYNLYGPTNLSPGFAPMCCIV